MHDERKAWRGRALGGPLQHLKIAVRIAERGGRTLTDMLVDADGLARPVIDEVHLRKAKQYRNVPAQHELCLDARAHNLRRRYAIDSLRPRPHEFDTATRHDVGSKIIRPQIGHQFEHRFVHTIGIRTLESWLARLRNPIDNDTLEIIGTHVVMRRHDYLNQAPLPCCLKRLDVTIKQRLEGLLLLPLRMLTALRVAL